MLAFDELSRFDKVPERSDHLLENEPLTLSTSDPKVGKARLCDEKVVRIVKRISAECLRIREHEVMFGLEVRVSTVSASSRVGS